ncbi:endothelin-converting enzyme 2b [Gadus macrocephalus]|uniref:endothelin-converting enzyme 2b n=1 Tax=Gadus macrocephalus TaxID=80720 RepID=UPI0028CBBD7F|nr:endothelin-converting enzyme 2b [Gadus macrocephalus]
MLSHCPRMSVALQDLRNTMSSYKRATFEEEEASDLPRDGSPSPEGVEVGFRKGSLGGWTQLEVWLAALLLVSVLLLLLTLTLGLTQSPDGSKELCLSEACVMLAGRMAEAMDRQADPCQDFYQYACGGWTRKNPLPDARSRWSTFNSLWEQNQALLKHILENGTFNGTSEAERKTQSYYLSCLNQPRIDQLGAQPLIDLITKLGGWSITGRWEKDNFMEVLKLLSGPYRAQPFFSLGVSTDPKNSNSNVIQVEQSGIFLPSRDYYLNKTANEKVLDAYLEYMVELGLLLGGSRNSTEQEMRQILELETALANITVPQDQRRDEEKLYHKITIADLQVLAPAVDWLDLLSSSLSPLELNDTEPVVIYTREYLVEMSQLIARTDRSLLNNYMIWTLVQKGVASLDQRFENAQDKLLESLYGTKKSCTPRWQTCIGNTDDTMGFALGALFVKETFDRNSKGIAEQMINEIRTAFKESLDQLSWMDPDTREAAKDKADAIYDMIGFPDFILDPKELDDVYDGYEVGEESFFNNMFNFYNFSSRVMSEQLRKRPSRDQWSMTPPTVNAYYMATKNGIVFPAGILQAPFYSHDHPKALNFGGIGVVMGHELTHALTTRAREYDKEGNMRPWWQNSSAVLPAAHECMVSSTAATLSTGRRSTGGRPWGEHRRQWRTESCLQCLPVVGSTQRRREETSSC